MKWIALLLLSVLVVSPAMAQTVYFTDEAMYLAYLSIQGRAIIFESFEADSVWGVVRTTISDPNYAPSVTSQGITWISNHPENQVTTSSGPARTGDWGFYSMPHGNFSTGTDCDIPGVCGDGFIGSVTDTIFGVGGWITGTFGGRLELILDGDTLSAWGFDGQNMLQNEHKFFGVVKVNGFKTFEYRETEGVSEDQKFMWADDFTLGVSAAVSVLITNFFARPVDQGVELFWEVFADEQILGFKIYRESATGVGGMFLLDGELLPPLASSYIDTEATPGEEYLYSLFALKNDGSEIVSLTAIVKVPARPMFLRQNYPNPFNPITSIEFHVDVDAGVSLVIYDVTGRHVRTLVDRRMAPGVYLEVWDGMDANGLQAASGMYFYRLTVGKNRLAEKMILLK